MLAKQWISMTSKIDYYIHPEEVKVIQFEPTSYCNLRCVACSRTDKKTMLPKQIVLDHQQHIPLELIEPIFKDLKNLKRIKFDGDIGDCFSHPKLYDIVTTILKLLPEVNILLHTNLCGGTDETFLKLIQLNQVRIVAGVDGLREHCNTYRRGSSWSIIQKRFEMMRDVAPYKHRWRWLQFNFNKHQQDEARQMSIDYKFNSFETAVPYGGSEELVSNIISDSEQRTSKGTLKDKSESKEIIKTRNLNLEQTYEEQFKSNPSLKHYTQELKVLETGRTHRCPWQVGKSLQVMSDGSVWPCCWSSDLNKFLDQLGITKVSQQKFYLNSDFEQQYYLNDWLAKLGKSWQKEIKVSNAHTISDVLSSKVYKKLAYLLEPRKDRYNLDFCTHNCKDFNDDHIQNTTEKEGHILTRALQSVEVKKGQISEHSFFNDPPEEK